MKNEKKTLFLIIAIFIAACIETDIFLPAMVDMMNYFSVSEESIQSLLTLNFVGICISCPLYGPISDAFGRKKPLIAALSLFLIGSILTLFATDFTTMLSGRVLQGLGSGGCFTLGTAIIFDYFQKDAAVVALNKINAIVPFIMALAPLMGGYLNSVYGFHSNFLAIGAIVLLSFLISLFFFKETLPVEERKPFNRTHILNDFKTVMSNMPFWQVTCVVCLIFSGYIAFLSTISVLYVREFGVSKEVLPAFQGALLVSWLLANLIFNKGINYFGTEKMKTGGAYLLAFGGIGLGLIAFLFPQNPILQTALMCFYALGANWINGIYFPEAMEIFPEQKGTAASLLTCARLLISALIVYAVSRFYDGSVLSITVAVFAITLTVSGLIFAYERGKKLKLICTSDLQN